MATFKVGQRVKRISDPDPHDRMGLASQTAMPIGATGVVERINKADVFVRNDATNARWPCYSYTLAPLTDPKADAFLKSIKKLKPYEEPKVFQGVPLERVE